MTLFPTLGMVVLIAIHGITFLEHSYWIATGNVLCTHKSAYLARSVAVLYVLEKNHNLPKHECR